MNETPGLVCAHHHLYSALARGMPAPSVAPTTFRQILERVWWRLDRALDLEMIRWSAMLGALEALERGTTAILDHHASPSAIEGSLSVISEACREVGVRVSTCYEVTDRNGPDEARAGLAENERYLREEGSGYVGAHACFTLSPETLAEVADLARRLDVGVHIHVAEGPEDQDAGRRLEPLARESWLLVHAVHLDRDLPGTVVHNPVSNMNNAVGYAAPASLRNAVALGTDGIGGDVLEVFRVAYARARESDLRFSAETAWGWLETGWDLFPEAREDRVIWSYEPMEPWHLAFTPGVRPLRVVVDGETVLEDGRADARRSRRGASPGARATAALVRQARGVACQEPPCRSSSRTSTPASCRRKSRCPRAPIELHRRLPDYAPTELVDAASIASELGLGRVLVKDESRRFGLPSFKLLGASWATYRALVDRRGEEFPPFRNVSELAGHVESMRPLALAAATDGNHGRAVARMAHWLGLEARIFVPAGTKPARIEAIESEGARCEIVDGDYDRTVARSAEEAGRECLVISDTSWPGYERVPRWVVEGYSTIFREMEAQIEDAIDVAFVPLGVGALGAAAVDYFRRERRARVVGVEPETCACVLESVRAGKLVTIPGPHPSIMAGLNCGTPSIIAFPRILAGLEACVAVEDPAAEAAMRELAACGMVSGETGAAALAGLRAVMAEGNPLGLGGRSTVVLLSTEGATDPEGYERAVGRPPESVRRP